MKDWRGTPIRIGSIVVYPSRQSSSMWMNEGEVVEIEEPTEVQSNRVDGTAWSYTMPGNVSVRSKKSGRVVRPGANRVTVIA